MMSDVTIPRLRIAQRVVFPTLGVSFLTYAYQAYSQIKEVEMAGHVAEKLQNASLAQGCLFVTALSIAAVCYMARLMFLVLQAQNNEKEDRLKRMENQNRQLTEKLMKQPSDGPH